MDGKRRKFARFYFVSEADLLDILSNGSQPKMILRHVDKVLLNTKELVLDETQMGPSGRPWAGRFIAGVGKESAEFEPKIPLEGKVETYLQEVLKGQRDTLKMHLKRCNDRYPSFVAEAENKRHDWVLYTGPDKKEPDDAAQIILLVAGFYYVNEVESCMGESEPVGLLASSLPACAVT